MNSRKSWLFYVCVLIPLLSTVNPVWGYTYTGEKWKDPSRLNVKLDSSVYTTNNAGQTYSSIYNDAFAEWSKSLGYKIIFQATNAANYDIFCNVHNWGDVGWDGEASTYHKNNIIYLGHAKINTYYTDPYTFNTTRGVAVHEIGHILGLDHVSSTSAVMHPKTTYRIPTKPASDDINGVKNLYQF